MAQTLLPALENYFLDMLATILTANNINSYAGENPSNEVKELPECVFSVNRASEQERYTGVYRCECSIIFRQSVDDYDPDLADKVFEGFFNRISGSIPTGSNVFLYDITDLRPESNPIDNNVYEQRLNFQTVACLK